MSRWPRRRQELPADMPTQLREFSADDWREWMLEGPDPALEAFHDRDSTAFYASIADRPDLVARWREEDAFRRWTEVRRSWLAEHVSEEAALDFWIDAISERHRARNNRRLPATPQRGW